MWAFFMSIAFENSLQRLTVLTIYSLRNLLVGILHANGPWLILV
jgi:hypothetical protein